MTRLHRFSCTALLSLALSLSGGVLASAPAYASAAPSDQVSSPVLPEPPGSRPHDFGWQ
ncbi:hypothetical protein OG338_09520 [Streptomyces sp. NBC_00726]|uniref:hypothetical protein n=1 Tax=Streptomyces sp. NBC_00726 TaxID=2903674 RepID=UPI00386CF20D